MQKRSLHYLCCLFWVSRSVALSLLSDTSFHFLSTMLYVLYYTFHVYMCIGHADGMLLFDIPYSSVQLKWKRYILKGSTMPYSVCGKQPYSNNKCDIRTHTYTHILPSPLCLPPSVTIASIPSVFALRSFFLHENLFRKYTPVYIYCNRTMSRFNTGFVCCLPIVFALNLSILFVSSNNYSSLLFVLW